MQDEQVKPKDEEQSVDQNEGEPSNKNFKKVVIGVGLIILFMIFAPPLYKDKVVAVFTFATTERQCMKYHVKSFVDPSSAYLEDSYVIDKTSALYEPKFGDFQTLVSVKIFGKNRMGAYVSDWYKCPVKDNGMVDTDALNRMR